MIDIYLEDHVMIPDISEVSDFASLSIIMIRKETITSSDD